jgi:hypothetical protein
VRNILISVVLLSFLISGCAGTGVEYIKVYKFKKDRVDQSVKGNRGYITGESPEAPSAERKSERTLIGVDIDVPAELFPPFGKDLEEEGEQPKKGTACEVPKEGKKAEPEEEWIK